MRGEVQASRGAVSLAAERRPIVVKLGGSVVRSPELPAWLDTLAASKHPLVVVPGGGALADEVRARQANLGFSDPIAHRMALLAMDQLAWAVAGLRPGFEVGASESDLTRVLDQGRVPIWAPYALISARADIEESWRLSSDSLALWLAARLGARACYLIKSVARTRGRMGAGQLARDGVVDAAFPSMLAASNIPAFLLGRGDQAAFAAALAEQQTCGAEIE